MKLYFHPTIRAIVYLAKMQDIQQWFAEMEPFLFVRLAELGIHFDKIGPLIEYHGVRQICHKKVDEWLARIRAERLDVWEVLTDKGRLLN